jgi:hypothetical protein
MKKEQKNMKLCTSEHEVKWEKKRMFIKFSRNIQDMLVDNDDK